MKAQERIKLTPEQIIRDLGSNSVLRVWEAAMDVYRHHERNSQLNNALLKMLRRGKRPFHRCAAAHSLGFSRYKNSIAALEHTIDNKNENPRVRGYAAEALANAKRSIPILTKCLRDPSKVVRFWCIYALGIGNGCHLNQAKIALPALRELAQSDKRTILGYWSVQDEALWAIANIEGREKDALKIERRLFRDLRRARKRKTK